MSVFTAVFNTDGAAFDGLDGDREIARILRGIADKFDTEAVDEFQVVFGQPKRIHDINGNRVWFFAWSDQQIGETE